MPHDGSTVAPTRTDSVSEDARVRHYDELGEDAQRLLADVADGDRTAGRAPELADGDVVVYTAYYRIERAGDRVGD